MRKVRVVAVVMLAGLAAMAGLAFAGREQSNDTTFEYAIGLWGDLPYSDQQATTGVPNLIADMNASDIEFSVHDGDLKVGSGVPGSQTPTTCSDAMYVQALGFLGDYSSVALYDVSVYDITVRRNLPGLVKCNGGFNQPRVASTENIQKHRGSFSICYLSTN